VRRDHQLRPAAAAPLARRDHVAFAVDRRVLEAELPHPLQEVFGPDFLLVGRRRNFGDALLFGQSRIVVRLDVLKCLHDFRIGEDELKRRIDRCPRSRLRAAWADEGSGRQQAAIAAATRMQFLIVNPLSRLNPDVRLLRGPARHQDENTP
jgi:hypothetical protein